MATLARLSGISVGGPRFNAPSRPRTARLRAGLLGLVVVLTGCGSGAASPTASSATTAPPSLPVATATPAIVAPESIPDRTVTPVRVTLPGAASPSSRIVASPSMMWVASATGLWGVDPATNRVTKTVTLPVGPEFLTYGFNSLWVTNFDAQVVLRVDPASGHVLARIPTAHPQGIVTTAEGVWVANHHEGKVTLIDPATNEAAAAVPVGPTGPSGPQGMAVIDGMIWVGMFNASQVVAVDPATRTVTTTVKDLSAPCGDLAASGSDLWVSECGEQKSVDQVDLSTGTFIRNTWVAGYVGTPIPVTDGVWLPLNGAARLLRMSDVTGQPVDAIGLPDCARDDLSSASVAFGSIWITCGQSLLRLAPSQLP